MYAREHPSKHLATLFTAALIASLALSAMAGEFNEIDGVAIGGFDPVTYLTEQKAVEGSAEITGTFRGSTFRFQSAANRDAFIARPDKFAPQYNGYCAYGVSRGYKAAISPDAFSVVDGKLYLNYSAEVKTLWAKDVPGYIGKADAQWTAVEKTTKVIR